MLRLLRCVGIKCELGLAKREKESFQVKFAETGVYKHPPKLYEIKMKNVILNYCHGRLFLKDCCNKRMEFIRIYFE